MFGCAQEGRRGGDRERGRGNEGGDVSIAGRVSYSIAVCGKAGCVCFFRKWNPVFVVLPRRAHEGRAAGAHDSVVLPEFGCVGCDHHWKTIGESRVSVGSRRVHERGGGRGGGGCTIIMSCMALVV